MAHAARQRQDSVKLTLSTGATNIAEHEAPVCAAKHGVWHETQSILRIVSDSRTCVLRNV